MGALLCHCVIVAESVVKMIIVAGDEAFMDQNDFDHIICLLKLFLLMFCDQWMMVLERNEK